MWTHMKEIGRDWDDPSDSGGVFETLTTLSKSFESRIFLLCVCSVASILLASELATLWNSASPFVIAGYAMITIWNALGAYATVIYRRPPEEIEREILNTP